MHILEKRLQGCKDAAIYNGGGGPLRARPGKQRELARSSNWECAPEMSPLLFFMEKETATYSSVLTWRIPWAEEPGRLQSLESQKVGGYLVKMLLLVIV